VLYFYKARNLVAVRKGEWKYYRRHNSDNGAYPFFPQGPFLFNLNTDPYESYNLLDDYPEMGQELEALLNQQDLQNETNPRGWL
jgi:arylsulfatase A-like enzyme